MASTSFDLNEALRNWRIAQRAASLSRGEDLDELEGHLRDSVEAWEGRGLAAEEAFWVATRRLGRPGEVAEEWAKVHPAEIFRTRAIWMLVGILLSGFLGDVSRVVSGVVVWGGANLGGAGTPWLGWVGLVGWGGTLVLFAVLFVRFALGFGWGVTGVGMERLGRAWLLVPGMLGVLLVARSAAWLGSVVLARELGPTDLGSVYMVQAWGQAVGGVFFVVLAVLFLGALVSRGAGPKRLATTLGLVGLGLMTVGVPTRVEAASGRGVEVAAAAEPAGFDGVLRLWGAGKKEEALRQFLAVDFTRRPLFPKGSVLGYSEKEYVALPRAVNSKLQPQILEEVRPMKGLAVYVREAAAAAAERGDKAKSGLYLGQLRKCGEALEHPDGLALVRLVGKAITRMASEAEGGVTPAKGR